MHEQFYALTIMLVTNSKIEVKDKEQNKIIIVLVIQKYKTVMKPKVIMNAIAAYI